MARLNHAADLKLIAYVLEVYNTQFSFLPIILGLHLRTLTQIKQ